MNFYCNNKYCVFPNYDNSLEIYEYSPIEEKRINVSICERRVSQLKYLSIYYINTQIVYSHQLPSGENVLLLLSSTRESSLSSNSTRESSLSLGYSNIFLQEEENYLLVKTKKEVYHIKIEGEELIKISPSFNKGREIFYPKIGLKSIKFSNGEEVFVPPLESIVQYSPFSKKGVSIHTISSSGSENINVYYFGCDRGESKERILSIKFNGEYRIRKCLNYSPTHLEKSEVWCFKKRSDLGAFTLKIYLLREEFLLEILLIEKLLSYLPKENSESLMVLMLRECVLNETLRLYRKYLQSEKEILLSFTQAFVNKNKRISLPFEGGIIDFEKDILPLFN